jgi:hypothetical protein
MVGGGDDGEPEGVVLEKRRRARRLDISSGAGVADARGVEVRDRVGGARK